MNRFCMAPHGKLLTNFCLIWHIGDEKGLTQQSCFRSYVRRGRGRRNDLDFRWVGGWVLQYLAYRDRVLRLCC